MKSRGLTGVLGWTLLLLVAVVHYGYDPIAEYLVPEIKYAPAMIFYVLRGFEGAVLFALLAVYLPRSIPVVVACAWGFLENVQTAVCRLAAGIGGALPGPYRGLCDIVTGYPVSIGTILIVLVAVAIAQESQK